MVSIAARTRLVSRHGTKLILFTMCLGVFIAQLDSQVVNLAIKHIGTDLNYLGGGLVELAGALIAFAFVPDDALEQRKA